MLEGGRIKKSRLPSTILTDAEQANAFRKHFEDKVEEVVASCTANGLSTPSEEETSNTSIESFSEFRPGGVDELSKQSVNLPLVTHTQTDFYEPRLPHSSGSSTSL